MTKTTLVVASAVFIFAVTVLIGSDFASAQATSFVPDSLTSGDILVLDILGGTDIRGAIYVVDPSTGNRVLLSDFGDPTQGPIDNLLFDSPRGLAINNVGDVFVGGINGPSSDVVLFVVDSKTGERVILSNFGNVSQGPTGNIIRPSNGIALDNSGNIVMAGQTDGSFQSAVLKVDPNGNRSVLSSSSQGSGIINDLTIDDEGNIFATVSSLDTKQVISIDPLTGSRFVVSDGTDSGQGDLLNLPRGIVVETSGNILIADRDPANLFRIDTSTGNRMIFSDFPDPTASSIPELIDVIVDASENILIADTDGALFGNGLIHKINPITGDRLILSDFSDPTQGILGPDAWALAIFPDMSDNAPPRILKLDAQTELAGITVTDKKDEKRINTAIKKIGNSLDDKLWDNDFTLTKHGNKVFDLEKKAVKELEKVKSVNVSGIITILVDVDKTLAQIVIDSVPTDTGDKKIDKELAKANKEMDRAQKELDKNNPDKAIDHYKKAWKHAQMAIKHQIDD